MKASRRPSAFCAIEGGNWAFAMDVAGWPEENQLDQSPCPGEVCQMCQRAPSEAMVKTSRRPSAFLPTPGITRTFVLRGLFSGFQLLHDLPAMVCQMCQSVPSEPIVKTSRRPPVFCPTEGLDLIVTVGLPREVQSVCVMVSPFRQVFSGMLQERSQCLCSQTHYTTSSMIKQCRTAVIKSFYYLND